MLFQGDLEDFKAKLLTEVISAKASGIFEELCVGGSWRFLLFCLSLQLKYFFFNSEIIGHFLYVTKIVMSTVKAYNKENS